MTGTLSIVGKVRLAGRNAPSRVMFGPHPTNLGRGRAFSDRHVAYYARRAAGGAGLVVTETASVHPADWPYERSPLAAECVGGWARVAQACHPFGTLVLAGLGHTGAQGSSAYGQNALWAPSRVPDTVSRELPMEMEQPELDAVVQGFADAAAGAVSAGTDGVEVDAGPGALLRQFHSGLTNHRGDGYGSDRLRLTREVLTAVRSVLGADRVLALRLCCDELAPWAGVTPEQAVRQAVELSGLVDLLVVTRGGPYTASAYRPDGHTPPMFNRELSRVVRAALAEAGATTQVVLQGSVVDGVAAATAVDDGSCDLVEMTRAMIADAELVAKLRDAGPGLVRPCVLCNQACQVRDNRNPIVSCVADPRSGHESRDPDPEPVTGATQTPRANGREVVVVGAGPAGLEAARVLAGRGRRVRIVEREDEVGGAARSAAALPGRARFGLLVDWWRSECTRLGVRFELGLTATAALLEEFRRGGAEVLLATGGRPGPRSYPVRPGAVVHTDVDLLRSWPDAVASLPEGDVVVLDLVGGPIGLGLAELLAGAGRQVAVVTSDQIVGTQLALSGDLADGNTRLLQAGVVRHTSRLLREVGPGTAVLEDRFSGRREEIGCAVLVHCGHRLPEEELYLAGTGTGRAGDCVAPRSVLEAVLEGRRAAAALEPLPAAGLPPVHGAWVRPVTAGITEPVG